MDKTNANSITGRTNTSSRKFPDDMCWFVEVDRSRDQSVVGKPPDFNFFFRLGKSGQWMRALGQDGLTGWVCVRAVHWLV
jgi:hypothetical protein